MTIELIDSHTHLDFEDFKADFEGVLERAKAAGVVGMVTIGSSTGLESAEKAIELAKRYPNIWASAGVHPHSAATPFEPEKLKAFCAHPRVVAIGETGLDFFRDWAPKEAQDQWFRSQIEIAKELKKPLIIHSRDAGQECLKILIDHQAHTVGGVFHCFSEDEHFAKRLADINFLVSFPGTVTFKKNDRLREIVKAIPLEQMMVETDAPYMSPEPYRGKRCESSFVLETAKMIAKVKQMDFNECAKILTATTRKFFRL